MKVSVIIPAFNEEKLLGATLQAVTAAMPGLTRRGWDTELIVCDNNSTDRTAELARGAGARVVFEPVNQISRARNTGAAAATGEWLLFIDADSQPTEALFADVAEAIAAGKCLAGGSTVRMETDQRWALRGCRFWNWISVRRSLLAGSFIFCEAKAFRAVGGFSQDLFASEEIDLSAKLKKFGAAERKGVVILRSHPLLTSARKLQLYTMREQLRFLAGVMLRFGRPLRSRAACYQWYDGRR